MQLPVELFLALRYLRPRRTFVSIITVLTFLGVTLGVGALIVVLSVMAGFQQVMTEKIIGFNAHLTVAMADGAMLRDYDALTKKIESYPGVLAAAPFILGPVVVVHNGDISTCYIKSIPADADDPVIPLRKTLKLGDWELRGDSVLVGSEWGKRNSAFPGDKITIFGPAQISDYMHRNDKNASTHLPQDLTIQGVFETGRFDYDLNFLLVSTETAQEIWGAPDAVHGIAVRLRNADDAEAMKDKFNATLPDTLSTRTWMDNNRELFNAVETERVVMACLLCLILTVASFGLCSTLITVTVQKSREIGLMKALGATDLQVCHVFLFHGTVVGIVGAILGTLVGFLFLHYLNAIRDFLLFAFHIQVFSGSVYFLPQLPALVNYTQVAMINLAAILVCMLAALVPAVSAATLAPARALRYE